MQVAAEEVSRAAGVKARLAAVGRARGRVKEELRRLGGRETRMRGPDSQYCRMSLSLVSSAERKSVMYCQLPRTQEADVSRTILLTCIAATSGSVENH